MRIRGYFSYAFLLIQKINTKKRDTVTDNIVTEMLHKYEISIKAEKRTFIRFSAFYPRVSLNMLLQSKHAGEKVYLSPCICPLPPPSQTEYNE